MPKGIHVWRVASRKQQAKDFEEYDRLQAEQQKLGFFRPWMTHSIFEGRQVVFHTQLTDYVTIDEYSRTMLEELEAR